MDSQTPPIPPPAGAPEDGAQKNAARPDGLSAEKAAAAGSSGAALPGAVNSAAQKNGAPVGDVSEAELARAAGVARADLRRLREQLREGQDWYQGDGGRVMLKPEGRAKLQRLLALERTAGEEAEAPRQRAAEDDLPTPPASARQAAGAGVGTAMAAAGEKGAGGPLAAAAEAVLTGMRYVELVVVRVASPRMLMAAKKGEPTRTAGIYQTEPGAPVRVMVRESKLFIPGMLLDKCEASETAGLFYYHGRMPRMRGRY